MPLHPDLRSEIIAYRAAQARESVPLTGWLFPSTQRQDGPVSAAHLGKLMTAALPGKYTPHTLRHRFATAAYLSQRDLRAVQELLGHAKPETTARYAAVPDGALRSAVNGVGLG